MSKENREKMFLSIESGDASGNNWYDDLQSIPYSLGDSCENGFNGLCERICFINNDRRKIVSQDDQKE